MLTIVFLGGGGRVFVTAYIFSLYFLRPEGEYVYRRTPGGWHITRHDSVVNNNHLFTTDNADDMLQGNAE